MGRRDDHHQLEEGCELMLDWRKLHKVATCGDDVVPVAVQDADTREMLILAYANEHALAEARRRGVCVLWSTSRRKLWIKGETSGDVLDLVEIRVNCEQNSLLYLVKPRRTGACHTRGPDGRTRRSCFYRALEGDAWLVKRPSPKSVGYSPEAVFGAFLLGFLLSKAKAPRLPTWLFGAARNAAAFARASRTAPHHRDDGVGARHACVVGAAEGEQAASAQSTMSSAAP